MQSVDVRFLDELLAELDTLVQLGWYKDRSSAVRDATRHLVLEHEDADGAGGPTLDFDSQAAQIRADGGEQ